MSARFKTTSTATSTRIRRPTPRGGSSSLPPPRRAGAIGLGAVLLLALAAPGLSRAQSPGEAKPSGLDTTLSAGEADSQQPPARGLAKYNTFDLGFTDLRIGYGFLVDFATVVQDEANKQQVGEVEPDVGLRDFRLLFKGKFKTRRPLSWTMGAMYDGPTDSWRFRQTGLMIGVPELSSSFFIGRTKEGYSAVKVMAGYDIWSIERSPVQDAFIPILADGVKWMGFLPEPRLIWNLGFYTDLLSENESFSTFDNQIVARLAWLPILSEPRDQLLHLAVMGRDAEPDEGRLRPRARPESFLSPYYVDAGSFAADHARTVGVEAYYRAGPWLVGSEYNWQSANSAEAGDPLFHGGDVSLVWLITGETRGYNTASGYFKAVSPKKTIFEGGPGAWEVTLRMSYADFDGGTLRGGKFWRVTPLVKWHLMDYLRIELGYGYGVLERHDLKGETHFFQGRILTAL